MEHSFFLYCFTAFSAEHNGVQEACGRANATACVGWQSMAPGSLAASRSTYARDRNFSRAARALGGLHRTHITAAYDWKAGLPLQISHDRLLLMHHST